MSSDIYIYLDEKEILPLHLKMDFEIPKLDFNVKEVEEKKIINVQFVEELEDDYHYASKEKNRRRNTRDRGLF